MTIGASGSYAINASNLTLQPSTHQWQDRQTYGFDGAAHPIQSAVRTYELGWQLMSPAEFTELVTHYRTVQNTGTVAVDLPQFDGTQYQFYRYSGCTLSEPIFGDYFNGYLKDVRMLIYNIRT